MNLLKPQPRTQITPQLIVSAFPTMYMFWITFIKIATVSTVLSMVPSDNCCTTVYCLIARAYQYFFFFVSLLHTTATVARWAHRSCWHNAHCIMAVIYKHTTARMFLKSLCFLGKKWVRSYNGLTTVDKLPLAVVSGHDCDALTQR